MSYFKDLLFIFILSSQNFCPALSHALLVRFNKVYTLRQYQECEMMYRFIPILASFFQRGTRFIFISEAELRSCGGTNGLLKYEVGKSYSYFYESRSWMENGKNIQLAPLEVKVNGKVFLIPISDCQFLLTLNDATLTPLNSPDSEEGLFIIPNSSIRFVMENGIVEEALFDSNEPAWTVNIKKAIVSMIMNPSFSPNMDKTVYMERGIHGNCVTEFSESDSTYTKIVELSECGEGEGSSMISQGVPYQVPLVKNKYIFELLHRRTLKCEQKLEDGILKSSLCELKRGQKVLDSFNYDMEATLTYTSTRDKIQSDDDVLATLQIPTDLIYNFTMDLSPQIKENAEKDILNILNSLNSQEGNKAKMFMDLKRAISRVSNLPDVQQMEEMQQKVFYDAVAEVTTNEGVELLANLVTNDKLDTETRWKFYTNIPFATNPGTKALVALTQLITKIPIEKRDGGEGDLDWIKYKENVTLSQLLLLGASGLAHQYCQMTNPSCGATPQYIALVDIIAKHVNLEEGNEELTLGALYALGNLDSLTPNAVETLDKLIKTEFTPPSMWAQLSALDAFRRDPCQSTLKQSTRDLLLDETKTNEVRIQAYLAASKCIDSQDLTVFQTIFASSPGIGGFIASHVRNILDSSSPSKLILKERLKGIEIPQNLLSLHNQGRSSKFIEFSSFKEKNNIGFSLDGYTIFSGQDPRPQFLTINATIDLWGRSFNFIEIGLSNRKNNKYSRVFYGEDEPAHWYSLVDALQSEDSYYRVFGTTVGIGLHGLHTSMQMAIKKLIPAKDYTEGAIIDFIQPSTILWTELTYPTLTGLPLTFNLQAVNFDSMKIKVTGAADIMKLMMNFATSDLDLKVNVETDSARSMIGMVGIGGNTPYHMAYKFEGDLDEKMNFELEAIKNEKDKVEIKINFPHQIISSKKMSLNGCSVEEFNGILVHTIPLTQKPSSDLALVDNNCVKVNIITGLKFCQQIIREKDSEFLGRITFTVEKENTEMKGYHISFIHHITENFPDNISALYKVKITTPDSAVNRELEVTYASDYGWEQNQYWEKKDLMLEGVLSMDKYMTHLTFTSQEVSRSTNFLGINDGSLNIEYATPYSEPKELLKVRTDNSATSFGFIAEFGGPLKSRLGNIKYALERVEEIDEEIGFISETFTTGLSIKTEKMESGIQASFTSHRNNSLALTLKAENNGKSYEGVITRDVRDVEEEAVPGDIGFIITVEKYENIKLNLLEDGKMNREIDIEYEWKSYPLKFRSTDLRVTLQDTHPIVFSAGRFWSPEELNSSLTLFGWDRVQGNLSYAQKGDLVEVQGYWDHIFKLDGSLLTSSKDQSANIHLLFQNFLSQIVVRIDSVIKEDGNEISKISQSIVEDKRNDLTYKTNTNTLIYPRNRSMTIVSKTTRNDEMMSKVDMVAHFAMDVYNGESSAEMTIEDNSGRVYKGKIVENAKSEGGIFNSEFDLQLRDPEKKEPLHFNWKHVLDETKKRLDKFDWEIKMSNDYKLSCEDFQMKYLQDIDLRKTKALEFYHMDSSGNLTINEVEITETEVQSWFVVDYEAGSVDLGATGFVQTNLNKDEFKGEINSKGKIESLLIQNITFSAERTKRESGEIYPLALGSVNKTIMFKCLQDFEMTEVGEVLVNSSQLIHWAQEIRCHSKELTIYKRITQEINGQEVINSNFLLDISAKLIDENDQSKISLKSHHNYGEASNDNIHNFNFTLSK